MDSDTRTPDLAPEPTTRAKKSYEAPAIEDSAAFEPLSMFCTPAFDGLPQCPDQSV